MSVPNAHTMLIKLVQVLVSIKNVASKFESMMLQAPAYPSRFPK